MPSNGCKGAAVAAAERVLGTRAPNAVGGTGPALVDFISDTLTDGRRFRVLYVVNDFAREYLALVAEQFSGRGH